MKNENGCPVTVIKTKGGMGNRMLCAASGLLWAKAVGRGAFVDWRDATYSRDGENSFFHFFKGEGLLNSPPAERGEVFPRAWRGNLDRTVSDMLHTYDPTKHASLRIHRKYSINPARSDYSQPIVVFWHYMGRFASMARLVRARVPGYGGLSVKGITRRAIREELKLSDLVCESMDAFTQAEWPDHVIGVHVRYSDLTANLEKTEKAVRRMVAEHPDAAIFLATDNKDIEDDYRSKFKSVLTTPKWFPTDGKPLHQHEHCEDPVTNGVGALVDMFLLSRCQGLVYSSLSTFSVISACLSDADPRMIVDLDRYNPVVRGKAFVRRLCS